MSTSLNCLMIAAIICALVGLGALVRYGLKFAKTKEGKRLIARLSGMQVVNLENVEALPTDKLAPDADPQAKLRVVEPGQVVKYTTDFGPIDHQVRASLTLQPMTQATGSKEWVEKNEKPSQIIRVGDEWILRVPFGEKGRPVWLKGHFIDVSGLRLDDFYKGTEQDPGPAKQFKRLKQSLSAPAVTYKLPHQLTPNTLWRIHDIGAFQIEVKGDADGIAENSDFVYFVTSKESGGEDWLVFLDARDEAVGTGGIFRCEPFSPSADIKQLF